MENTITIKPYEKIDDDYLRDMIIENMYHTQQIIPSYLIEGAISGYGWAKIIKVLGGAFLILEIILLLIGFTFLTAFFLSIACIVSVIFLVYVVFLPKKMDRVAKEWTMLRVTRDFMNTSSGLIGLGKFFWLATEKSNSNAKSGSVERIVGCIGVKPYDWSRDEYELGRQLCKELGEGLAELCRLSVAREHRRKGIGSKLIKKLIEYCKSSGYKAILLETLSNNKAAISAYEKAGFRIFKIETKPWSNVPCSSAILMMKL